MEVESAQQRANSDATSHLGSDEFRANDEEEIPETGSNPFLAKPFQPGEKDISSVVLPIKLKDEVLGRNHGSVMDAFASAIEAVIDGGFSNDGDGDRKCLLDNRPSVHFNFRTGKKFLGEFLDPSLLKKGAGRSTSFGQDDEKDDRKRRAEYILRQSMENPQELTQL